MINPSAFFVSDAKRTDKNKELCSNKNQTALKLKVCNDVSIVRTT
jgi:hypothetical protein